MDNYRRSLNLNAIALFSTISILGTASAVAVLIFTFGPQLGSSLWHTTCNLWRKTPFSQKSPMNTSKPTKPVKNLTTLLQPAASNDASTSRSTHTVQLSAKSQLTDDTILFTFDFASGSELEPSAMLLGLPVGNHLKITAKVSDNQIISRPYTPISPCDQLNKVDFLIKVYPQGLMSRHLEQLSIGSSIEITGPLGMISYHGNGVFNIRKAERKLSKVLFIAGGTGITPCYSVIQESIAKKDGLKMKLLFANKSIDDILLVKELDQFSSQHADQFSVFHTIDKVPENGEWHQGVGFINLEMVEKFLGSSWLEDKNLAVMICGPPKMVAHVKNLLTTLKINNYFSF